MDSQGSHQNGTAAVVSDMEGVNWGLLGSVQEAVLKVIGDHYGLYGRILRTDLHFERDLGSDRLDKLEILMTMEELFGIYFKDDAPDQMNTISDVIEAVNLALVDRQAAFG